MLYNINKYVCYTQKINKKKKCLTFIASNKITIPHTPLKRDMGYCYFRILLHFFNNSDTLRQKSYPFVDETSTAARSRGKL